MNPMIKRNATTVPIPNVPAVIKEPIWKIHKDTTYARIHCYPLANQNHFVLFISRLIAPIAAKHGAHSKLNTK